MAIVLKTHIEFRKFFDEFFPAVYALLCKYTEDSDLARDLTQEAFVKVYECRQEFETLDNAKAFLYTVARRLYFNHYNHVKVCERAFSFREEEKWEKSWLEEVTATETIRILYAAIDKLAPQTRKIILLNLQGMNNNEVAEELGISVNTVKSMKKSAYQLLRKYLDKEYLWVLLLLISQPS